VEAFEYFLVADQGPSRTRGAEQGSLRDAYEAMQALNRDCLAVAHPWPEAVSRRAPRVA
jgi:hypothetical protein